MVVLTICKYHGDLISNEGDDLSQTFSHIRQPMLTTATYHNGAIDMAKMIVPDAISDSYEIFVTSTIYKFHADWENRRCFGGH